MIAALLATLAIVAGASPLHTGITATVFWVGEPVGNGSTEDNALSAWDDAWRAHYGGVDDPSYRRSASYGFFPRTFLPKENPFYLDLPYDDFTNDGVPRPDRLSVVPWAPSREPGVRVSLLKNRWVMLMRTAAGRRHTCYGQIEDAGPYRYDDVAYVFGAHDARPQSKRAHNAGLDVSPALRDCLAFSGLDNDVNRVDWRFVTAADVPRGPWRRVVTTRQVFWP